MSRCNSILRRSGRALVTPKLERKLLGAFFQANRHPALQVRDRLPLEMLWNSISRVAQKGVAVTFIVHASKGEDATTTIRLSVVVAIAKGRARAEEGWQV